MAQEEFLPSRKSTDRSTSTDEFQESWNTLLLDDGVQTSPSEGDNDYATLNASKDLIDIDPLHPLQEEDHQSRNSLRSLDSLRSLPKEEQDWRFAWKLRLAVVRVACGTFVNSLPVQIFMSILIVANAVILGALTFDSIDRNVLDILEDVDLAILCAFTVEITLHGLYLGPRQLFKDSWLSFDFVVILLSWCFLGSSLAILRSFRIFRIFSLVSRWESLRTLFEAIGSTIPKMASIWASLLIVFYVFCVLFTTVWSDLYEDGFLDIDYFGNLGLTFVTLFQIMTLDNWTDVARQVMEYQPWAFVAFFVFILFSSFFIVNLVVAVICESLLQVSRGPQQEAQSTMSLRVEKDDKLLQDMMQQMLKNQSVMAASLRGLQQDVQMLKEQNEEKPVEYMQKLPDESPSTE